MAARQVAGSLDRSLQLGGSEVTLKLVSLALDCGHSRRVLAFRAWCPRLRGRFPLTEDLSKVTARVEGASLAYGSHGLSLLWEHDGVTKWYPEET